MKYKIALGVVTYNSNKDLLKKLFDSIYHAKNVDAYLIHIDNSPNGYNYVEESRFNYEYISKEENLGFGKANNIIIKKVIEMDFDWFVFVNPDISFEADVLEQLVKFSTLNPSYGFVSPKIKYSNGNIQYLCKLLPTPFDLFIRRFDFLNIFKYWNNRYELKSFNYDRQIVLPFISGCFIFTSIEFLKRVGLFDEQYFLYMEDVDFTRRANEVKSNIFYPDVCVTHGYQKGSYKNKNLMKLHIQSAIKYFNKWGWIIDRKRSKFNKNTLKGIKNEN
jgi:GT2 family glycosyltransferase